ncbi:hypothetical protein [Metabacillus iocasae]|uniref:DUF5050 domain-containing protein n=1 Tax=Priestia iocasae TaxID=2291674 RepID=A0ABS2QUP0_9BACI|nr:hypothetical protein [Metabacillus iocasae]MBM7702436.1 hypothetical protein [Metabacillus iocasae]
MKKIILLVGMLIASLAIGLAVKNILLPKAVVSSALIKEEDLQDKDFLKDKKAVLYLSTTADQDLDGSGLSYAVFIDKNGESSALQMSGLELGMMAATEDSLLVEEKNKVRIIGEEYKEFPMKKDQYTGSMTGYLKEEDLLFSIHNTGVNSQKGGYDSNIYFGNEQSFQTSNIPHYILTSGLEDHRIHIVTSDVETNTYALKEVTFTESKDDVQVKDVVTLDMNNKTLDTFSPILADEQHLYFVGTTYVNDQKDDTFLMRIHKQTHTQETFTLGNDDNLENPTAVIPYNVRNSAHLYNDYVYYIDGLGDVYAFHTKTLELKKAFSLGNNPSQDGVRYNDETYFKDGSLFVLRYDPNKDEKYYLEHYSLDTGTLNDTMDIKGLDRILSSVKNKSVYSYDLKLF